MELSVGGDRVSRGCALMRSSKPVRDELPGGLVGDCGIDEIGVLVVGLVYVGDLCSVYPASALRRRLSARMPVGASRPFGPGSPAERC